MSPQVEIAEITAPVPFSHPQRFSVGMAIVVEPRAVVEAVLSTTSVSPSQRPVE